jgi:hypothetical protein
MTEVNLDSKELAVIQKEVVSVEEEVLSLKIKNQDDLENAKLALTRVGGLQKSVKETKEGMTKPINDSLKAIRSFFAPIEEKLNNGEIAIKTGMKNYLDSLIPKQEAIAQRVENGTMKFETATQKIAKVEEKIDSIPTRKIAKVEIVDSNSIPREYLVIDMVKLRADLLTGKEVKGARLIYETIIVK